LCGRNTIACLLCETTVFSSRRLRSRTPKPALIGRGPSDDLERPRLNRALVSGGVDRLDVERVHTLDERLRRVRRCARRERLGVEVALEGGAGLARVEREGRRR